MRIVDLDATDWRTVEDAWQAILNGLEAPAWHGHNLDALQDTIGEAVRFGISPGDCINGVQPPFEIVVRNAKAAPDEVRGFLAIVSAEFASISADLTIYAALRTTS